MAQAAAKNTRTSFAPSTGRLSQTSAHPTPSSQQMNDWSNILSSTSSTDRLRDSYAQDGTRPEIKSKRRSIRNSILLSRPKKIKRQNITADSVAQMSPLTAIAEYSRSSSDIPLSELPTHVTPKRTPEKRPESSAWPLPKAEPGPSGMTPSSSRTNAIRAIMPEPIEERRSEDVQELQMPTFGREESQTSILSPPKLTRECSSGSMPFHPIPPLPLFAKSKQAEAVRRAGSPSRESYKSVETTASSILETPFGDAQEFLTPNPSPIHLDKSGLPSQEELEQGWETSVSELGSPSTKGALRDFREKRSSKNFGLEVLPNDNRSRSQQQSDVFVPRRASTSPRRMSRPNLKRASTSASNNPYAKYAGYTSFRNSAKRHSMFANVETVSRASSQRSGVQRENHSKLSEHGLKKRPNSIASSSSAHWEWPLLGDSDGGETPRNSRKGHRRQNCVRISIPVSYSMTFPPTAEEPEEEKTPEVTRTVKQEELVVAEDKIIYDKVETHISPFRDPNRPVLKPVRRDGFVEVPLTRPEDKKIESVPSSAKKAGKKPQDIQVPSRKDRKLSVFPTPLQSPTYIYGQPETPPEKTPPPCAEMTPSFGLEIPPSPKEPTSPCPSAYRIRGPRTPPRARSPRLRTAGVNSASPRRSSKTPQATATNTEAPWSTDNGILDSVMQLRRMNSEVMEDKRDRTMQVYRNLGRNSRSVSASSSFRDSFRDSIMSLKALTEVADSRNRSRSHVTIPDPARVRDGKENAPSPTAFRTRSNAPSPEASRTNMPFSKSSLIGLGLSECGLDEVERASRTWEEDYNANRSPDGSAKKNAAAAARKQAASASRTMRRIEKEKERERQASLNKGGSGRETR